MKGKKSGGDRLGVLREDRDIKRWGEGLDSGSEELTVIVSTWGLLEKLPRGLWEGTNSESNSILRSTEKSTD